MHQEERQYIAIDLKSFYASVECVERGLDPLTTNLVVADVERTEKTICLAVSPSLKTYGIGGRARLFEVVQKAKQAGIDFIAAKPRMALYMQYSTRIYEIYLRYVAPEDMHVYSVDEVFIDVTTYLKTYQMTARELAMKMIRDVLNETGVTATAGIGTNLYLCKIAMDIVAKKMPADENGVRIAELNEQSYKEQLWTHRPLTSFWRIGPGTARKLEENGLFTMGDVARCSLGKETDYYNEDLLYKLFGVAAELIIDHAWGYEPCTLDDIRSYKPENNSLSVGQVLKCPYDFEKAKLVFHEMADGLSLDLFEKGLVTDQIVVHIGYDIENLTDPERRKLYNGPVSIDHYGRRVPKHAHGSGNLREYTSSTKEIVEMALQVFERTVDPLLLVRRLNIAAEHVLPESEIRQKDSFEQLDLFTDYEALQEQKEKQEAQRQKEKKVQQALLDIKKRYGKNAIVKGMNLQEGATGMERNGQIGGHKA